MRTAKEDVEAMVRALPDDASYEDIQYRLYVLDKIRASKESIEREGGLTHEEVVERMQPWLHG